MAKTVTLASLLADIRALYETHTVKLSDELLTRWINRSLAWLWDVITAYNPDYFFSDAQITVVSGQEEYDMSTLVTDFYKGHGADVLLETGRWSPLGSFPWEERNLYANMTVTRADQLYRYMGSTLWLAPKPSWGGTIRVYYIPTATVLVGRSSPNTVDLFNSWEELVITDVALKCAISEESATTALENRRNTLLNEIKAFIVQRDVSHNDKIRDKRLSGRSVNNPFSRLPRPG